MGSGNLSVILILIKIFLFIPVQHFSLEALNVVLPQLTNQDWAVSLDLRDAYFHVPFHQQVTAPVGLHVSGADLPLQGSPVRSEVFTLGVRQVGGHTHTSFVSSRYSFLLLPGRLLLVANFLGSSRVSFEVSDSRVSGQLVGVVSCSSDGFWCISHAF